MEYLVIESYCDHCVVVEPNKLLTAVEALALKEMYTRLNPDHKYFIVKIYEN